MKLASTEDTIIACATPPGSGAIAVLRVSGPQAESLAEALCQQKSLESHRLQRVSLRHPADGRLLDDSMAVLMRGPRSYTGEDVLELHVHGSQAVVTAVLEACLASGARHAEPGEFTLRAFLNNRMDLTQAEAVADLIAAQSEVQRQVAVAQVRGSLSVQVSGFLAQLEGIFAAWQAALDFPEYPTGEGLLAAHLGQLQRLAKDLQELLDRARLDVHRGQRVVLCGAPNVGKSSVLNAWIGERRVLVDDSPGTTRDPVEVRLSQGGMQWALWDTAGIRDDAPELERQGIAMAHEQLAKADLALWLVDAKRPIWPPAGAAVVLVGSKADAVSAAQRQATEALAQAEGFAMLMWISAHTGEGLQPLREHCQEHLQGDAGAAPAIVVKQRHVEGLRRARDGLMAVLQGAAAHNTLDVLSFELEEAMRALGEILGRNVDAEVLNRIFRQFCIGK